MTPTTQERIAKFEINVESIKSSLLYYIKAIVDSTSDQNGQKIADNFVAHYDRLLAPHAQEDTTDLARLYRLITTFKPALSSVLPVGRKFDLICDAALSNFNVTLNRIREQVNDKHVRNHTRKKGPVLPGTNAMMDLQFCCPVCKEIFEIPSDLKAQLLDSDEKQTLPQHCGQEMIVQIAKIQSSPNLINDEEEFEIIDILSAEILMGHLNTADSAAEYLEMLSVGIDIGSSTSHLVFSRLTLKRETSFFNMTHRFFLVNRQIIYESRIIFTPLLDRTTIDIEAVVHFCQAEYAKAGFTPEMVDSGAVIVTGETAKKLNAAEIADRLSLESGKFVSATAGPNFESFLGIKGSGIVQQSQDRQTTIMNVDVGGGTSNIAIASHGTVVSCSCINVGGRLLGIEDDFTIWRIDGPTNVVMQELAMQYQLGDQIPEMDVKRIARAYAEALVEVMRGSATSPIAQKLMMTPDIDLSVPVCAYSFSGGIGELIYGDNHDLNKYHDIGHYLAEEIKNLIEKYGMTLIEPENKIRATVIGAGSFSLSVSGSTCFVDQDVTLPLHNIPILPVQVTPENFSYDWIVTEIHAAFIRFDLVEGEDVVGLYFPAQIFPQPDILSMLAKAIEHALSHSITAQHPIILLFQSDLAKFLGLQLHRQTAIQQNLICLDELTLESGDWIDIGPEIHDTRAYPVTVKSLAFHHESD